MVKKAPLHFVQFAFNFNCPEWPSLYRQLFLLLLLNIQIPDTCFSYFPLYTCWKLNTPIASEIAPYLYSRIINLF